MSFQCQQSQRNITSNPKFNSQYDSCNVQGPSENGKTQDLMCKKCAWKQRMCKNGNWLDVFSSLIGHPNSWRWLKTCNCNTILGVRNYLRLKNYFYGLMLNRSRGKLGFVQKYKESTIVDYIKKIQKKGHPITLKQLWLKVVEVTQKRATRVLHSRMEFWVGVGYNGLENAIQT
jgi:hypothetical protein